MNKTYDIVVQGRVQRVGYRAWALGIANRLGVFGWVKNLINGNVELLVNGEEDKVNEMIKMCNRGPALARVDNIVVNEIRNSAYDDVEKVFKIL